MRSLLAATLLLAAVAPAAADPSSGVDAALFRPSYDTGGLFSLEGARLPAPRDLSWKMWLSYARKPFDLAVPGILFDGEEMQLTQLVTNLLDNALKYVPKGGAIRLSLAGGPVLTVEDDGPGIAETDREKIFRRFYRSRGEASDSPGSGLGLALAKAIAERHDLTIALMPSDRGARFVVKEQGA